MNPVSDSQSVQRTTCTIIMYTIIHNMGGKNHECHRHISHVKCVNTEYFSVFISSVNLINGQCLCFRLIGPPELKKAMRTLGFKLSREEAQQVVADVSMKGRG